MRSALLALLLLTATLSFAHASDWLSWRKVGTSTLSWGPFTIYTAQLLTADGRYDGPGQNKALVITYKRNIQRSELVNATREQWQALGIPGREAHSEDWLNMLHALWPDVTPDAQLAFVLHDRQGQFWYRASASQKSFMPLGPRQSEAFSANFLAIWLSPDTQYPELRQQLIGGDK